MILRRCHLAVCLSWIVAWILGAGVPGIVFLVAEEPDRKSLAEPEEFFSQRIHPVLANRCYQCHSGENPEGGFRLDSRDALLKGGDSGEAAAIAGKSAESRLVSAIRHVGDLHMPPETKLPDEEIQLLAAWVDMGLPWPKSAVPVLAPSMAELAEQQRRTHWSLQPVGPPKLPGVRNEGWVATGVDAFVLARLESEGLSPSPLADRRTLIRRLTFDLLGLPPTMAEVEEFAADVSPDAYSRLVDRLLSSPAYGHRWGRHWLDVARYADTRGYAFGRERRYPYAYTYRDYVVDAWNADKPYDQFVVEQLAADLLPGGDDKSYLAAMGFLTTGRKFNNRHDDVDDQIDLVSRGLLGLTVACARCHDHKYDAVPTGDYYSLYGIFASSTEPDELPLIADPQRTAGYEAFQAELNKLKAEVEKFRDQKHAELVDAARRQAPAYLEGIAAGGTDKLLEKSTFISLGAKDLKPKLLERWREYLKRRAVRDDPVFGPWSELMRLKDDQFAEKSKELLARWSQPASGIRDPGLNPRVRDALLAQPPASRREVAQAYGKLLSEAYDQFAARGSDQPLETVAEDLRALIQVLVDSDSPASIPRDELVSYYIRQDREQDRALQKKVDSFQAMSPAAPPRAMVLRENQPPVSPRIFVRGNASRPGETIPRQFLLLVTGPDRRPFEQGSGRLELAQEIVDPGNPLTRRVIANRVWMHLAGQSLIRTPSDLGFRCEKPEHRELLDYLAFRLLDCGWSLKSLHREIVLSSTYRQSSVSRDAEGRVRDPENRWYWRMNRKRLEFEPLRDSLLASAGGLDRSIGGRSVDLMKPPFSRRRTIYGYLDRQDLPNLLRVFDFASPDQSQAERPRTTVPQQALYLMNSPFALEQASRLASRPEIAAAPDEKGRIEALYRILFQREPSPAEFQAGRQFVAGFQQAEPTNKSETAWEQYAHLLLLTNEFSYVD